MCLRERIRRCNPKLASLPKDRRLKVDISLEARTVLPNIVVKGKGISMRDVGVRESDVEYLGSMNAHALLSNYYGS